MNYKKLIFLNKKSMSNLIKTVQKIFEQIKIEDETWFEFWSAREF